MAGGKKKSPQPAPKAPGGSRIDAERLPSNFKDLLQFSGDRSAKVSLIMTAIRKNMDSALLSDLSPDLLQEANDRLSRQFNDSVQNGSSLKVSGATVVVPELHIQASGKHPISDPLVQAIQICEMADPHPLQTLAPHDASPIQMQSGMAAAITDSATALVVYGKDEPKHGSGNDPNVMIKEPAAKKDISQIDEEQNTMRKDHVCVRMDYAEDRNAKISLIKAILKKNQDYAIPKDTPRDLILEAKVRLGMENKTRSAAESDQSGNATEKNMGGSSSLHGVNDDQREKMVTDGLSNTDDGSGKIRGKHAWSLLFQCQQERPRNLKLYLSHRKILLTILSLMMKTHLRLFKIGVMLSLDTS